MEDKSFEFLSTSLDLMDVGDFDSIQDLVCSEESVEDVKDEVMNILPRLLTSISVNKEKYSQIFDIVRGVINVTSAKESLLVILEHLEETQCVEDLPLMFTCLCDIVDKLPISSLKQYELIFSSLTSKLDSISVDSKGCVSNDFDVKLMSEVVDCIYKLVSSTDSHTPSSYHQLILHFIVRIFQYPLILFSPGIDKFGQSLVSYVKGLQPHIQGDYILALSNTSYSVEDWDDVSPMATVCFYYHLSSSEMDDLANWFVATCPCDGVTQFVSCTTSLIHDVMTLTDVTSRHYGVSYKCVSLLYHIWSCVKSASIRGRLMEEVVMSCKLHQIPQILCDNILATCKDAKLGRVSVSCLKLIISQLPPATSYDVLKNLLEHMDNAGIISVLITIVKDYIDVSLRCSEGLDAVFKGDSLQTLLGAVMLTPVEYLGVEQFLARSDITLSLLNFIRYLVMRDPVRDNQTGIWDTGILAEVEGKYLEWTYVQATLCRAEAVRVLAGECGGSGKMCVSLVGGGGADGQEVGGYEDMVSTGIHTIDLILSTRANILDYVHKQQRLGQHHHHKQN